MLFRLEIKACWSALKLLSVLNRLMEMKIEQDFRNYTYAY